MKKTLLIAYPAMRVGGSTTSLISLLNTLNRDKYDIDLQLLENDGELQDRIPSWINVLPQARVSLGASRSRLKSLRYVRLMTQMLWQQNVRKNLAAASQLRSLAGFTNDRMPEKEYDAAISFLETWPTYYVARSIKARARACWLHLNYARSGMLYSLDKPYLDQYQKIILVSDAVREEFVRMAPETKSRAIYLPNLLSRSYVEEQASEKATLPIVREEGMTILVTVCRLSPVKALSRAVDAFARLQQDKLADHLRWLIIGDGEMVGALTRQITDQHLDHYIILMGARLRPMPFVRQCDAFFLPSYSEGKPMSVTEAQMLGLPAIVTSYPAAKEQMTDRVDGLIMENSAEGVYRGLRAVAEDPFLLPILREGVQKRDFERPQDIKAVEAMIDAL